MSALVVAENPAVPEAALADAPAEPVGEAAVNPKAKAKAKAKGKVKCRIDIDERIDEARATVKAAAKAMGAARAVARLERKKKIRLTRKAAQLSAEDLDRIAVLKRTGLWAPELGEPGIERLPSSAPAVITAGTPISTTVAPVPTTLASSSSSANAGAVIEAPVGGTEEVADSPDDEVPDPELSEDL
jgi:hypothetical protein